MKLTDVQAKVIAATQLDADFPISKLRKRIGLKDHTIRYALERARSRGIIERRHFINLFRLGYLQHEVFFSLSSEKRGDRETLVAELVRSNRISWMGRVGGDYQYGVNICSRHVSEVMSLFDDISERYGRVLVEKHLALRVSLTYFGHRYLYPSIPSKSPLIYRVTSDHVAIDRVDHLILSALVSEGNTSSHALARILTLPQSTVDYRIKKLRASGVIVGCYYNLNYEKLGIVSYLCLISIKGMSSLFRERALLFCEKRKEAVLLIESIGSWDFEIVINVSHAEDAMQIIEELRDYFGRDLQSIKTIPLFSYPKVKEYPF